MLIYNLKIELKDMMVTKKVTSKMSEFFKILEEDKMSGKFY